MSSIVFIIIGIGFLVSGYFGREGDFRWGRTGKGPAMSVRLGKTICLVIGLGFTLGGVVAVAIEFFTRR